MALDARLLSALAAIVGASAVTSDLPTSVAGVSTTTLVRPGDVDELCRVLVLASNAGLAVAACGGGTKLDMGNPPSRLDLLLDMSALDEVTEYDPENLTVSLQAGVRVGGISARLADDGLLLPLDPPLAEKATVGGVLACADHGPKRLGYGGLRDNMLGVKVALFDGTIVKFGGRTIKNVSGYDAGKLFIGSLGTLGILTEATFRLLPGPAREDLLISAFARMAEAFSVTTAVLDSVLLPAALEVVSPVARTLLPSEWADVAGEGYLLLVSVEGHPVSVERQIRDVAILCAKATSGCARCVTCGEAAGAIPGIPGPPSSFWQAYSALRWAAKEAGFGVAAKVSVPLSRTGALLAEAEAQARTHDLILAFAASAGTGQASVFLKGDGRAIERLLTHIRGVAEAEGGSLVLLCGRSVLGDGFDAWGTSRSDLPVMQAIKAKFDPRGLLSPGRFVGGL